MELGGLQKMTTVDYPGKIAATVFLIGCNFRCPYCHNPELVLPEKIKKHPKIKKSDFFKFLDKRVGLLEGVCITGGEPTLNSDLPEFISNIKKKGFLVKLDTNGTNYKMLKELIDKDLIDYISMDIKTSIKKYDKLLESGNVISQIKKSINIIKNSNKDYEFRTTVVPGIVNESDIKEIGQLLKKVKKFVLQQFIPGKTIDPAFEKIKPFSEEKLKKMTTILKRTIENVEVRA